MEEFNFTSSTDGRNVILKFHPDGSFLWAGAFGDTGNIAGKSIEIDIWGNIYFAGSFSGFTDFDPDLPVYELSATENLYDIFILKMNQEACNVTPYILSSNPSFVICPEDSNQLLLTANSPYWLQDYSLLWNTEATTDSITIEPDADSIISVQINYTVDSLLCSNTHSVEVIVVDSIYFTITADTEICQGESLLLSANGGVNYFWNNNIANSTQVVAPLLDTEYSVTVTEANGCTASGEVVITVHDISTTYLDFITCDSSIVSITQHIYSDQNGCDSLVISSTSLLPIPDAPILVDTIWLLPSTPVFQIFIEPLPDITAYIWQLPPSAQIISGDSTNHVFINWGVTTGNDSLCVIAINDCGYSAPTCKQIVFETASSVTNASPEKYAIFPNPTSGLVNVWSPKIYAGEYELRTSSGQLVLTGVLKQESQLDFSQVPQGVYLLILKTNEGIWKEKLVKF